MTINPLTMRLKAIKRELLALKTAHTRGLGNVKIYTSTITIDPSGHTTSFWDITIRIDFDPSFVAYPFVNIIPAANSSYQHTLELVGQDYANGGYSLNTKYIWRYVANTNSIMILATAPIVGYTYEWGE